MSFLDVFCKVSKVQLSNLKIIWHSYNSPFFLCPMIAKKKKQKERESYPTKKPLREKLKFINQFVHISAMEGNQPVLSFFQILIMICHVRHSKVFSRFQGT